jgi:hypothetical protein
LLRFCSRACKEATPEIRFWRNVLRGRSDECWLWNGHLNTSGYGQFSVNGRLILGHRFSFEMRYGPVLPGVLVLHRCDTPRCCNPAHLFLGTDAANAADKRAKGRCHDTSGVLNPRAKLTEADVRAIRALRFVPRRELSARFGVSIGVVSKIRAREIWTHVQD